MPLAEAKALLAPHPLTIQPSDAVADYRALEELAQQLQSFSPLVGLEDLPQPESLLLDIASCCQLFGGEAELAEGDGDLHGPPLVVDHRLAAEHGVPGEGIERQSLVGDLCAADI